MARSQPGAESWLTASAKDTPLDTLDRTQTAAPARCWSSPPNTACPFGKISKGRAWNTRLCSTDTPLCSRFPPTSQHRKASLSFLLIPSRCDDTAPNRSNHRPLPPEPRLWSCVQQKAWRKPSDLWHKRRVISSFYPPLKEGGLSWTNTLTFETVVLLGDTNACRESITFSSQRTCSVDK